MKPIKVSRFFARFGTLRWRLTLFYCGLLALLLAATGIFVYTRFESAQRAGIISRLYDLASLFKPPPSKSTGTIAFSFPGGSALDAKLFPVDTSEVKARFEQGNNLDGVYAGLLNADGTNIVTNQPLQISTIYNIEPAILPPAQSTTKDGRYAPVTYETTLHETLNAKIGPQLTEDVPGMVYAEPFWPFSSQTGPQDSGTPAGYLVLAIPLGDDQKVLQQLSSFLLTGGIGALLLALLLGLPLTRLGLRPLERIADTATQIGAGDLTRRVTLPDSATNGVQDEVQQLGKTFNAMLDEIEASFAAQKRSEARTRQFAADASHELRSPITIVGGYIDVLQLGAKDDPEQAARILRSMQRENDRLGRLVTDLLLLTRMDANGAASLRLEPTPLADIVRRACDNMRLLACEREITLSVSRSASNALVNGDGDQLYRVVVNLLDNAIRYTSDDGRIEVALDTVTHVASSRQHEWARLTITDNGCGIPADDLPRIFDRFYRADQSRDRQTGNAGLGLAICKSILEAHGGTIQAGAAPGGGATFDIELPTTDDRRPTTDDVKRKT
jgi:signal transduction histidine kinase